MFLLAVPKWCFYCRSFLLVIIHYCLCYAVLSVPCSLMVTYWEITDLLALLCVVFSCGIFGHFSICVLIHTSAKVEVGTVKYVKALK